ncbi:uncharacterized protein M6B38_256615 [Iris pallida]|uniref:Uncharacterized protein n=1 Tax=Iris pallida TaxID=29817 RepID=A0AAX6IIA4_IRIPA|nr:uncharacterized protein M6B38_256615 [Iris pallida]
MATREEEAVASSSGQGGFGRPVSESG